MANHQWTDFRDQDFPSGRRHYQKTADGSLWQNQRRSPHRALELWTEHGKYVLDLWKRGECVVPLQEMPASYRNPRYMDALGNYTSGLFLNLFTEK